MKVIKIEKKKQNRSDVFPDIDIDFTSKNRDDIKAYITDKFTEDQVCSLGSYGRLKLRQAFKDLCRVAGVDFKEANELTKVMDDQLEYSWKDIFLFARKSVKLYDFIQKNPQLILDLKVILNNPKSMSIHPSAIVVLPKVDKKGVRRTLETWMPIREIDGMIVSEWEGKYTDIFGVLKEDILGIKQLDKYTYCLNLIKENTGQEINLQEIDFNDEKVFKLFREGHNEDVFQFGSFGLKNFSKQVKPDSLSDLIAMNALYRPATMEIGAHKDFIDFKNGKKKPVFDFNMETVTKDTQGIYIYQEQVMQAVVVGGLTLLESDQMRTAIKKKDTALMGKFEVKFLLGMEEQGCSIEEAKAIWKKLLSFAGYGFNKCLSKDSVIKTTKGDINVVDLHNDFLKGINHTLYSVNNDNEIIEQDLSKVFYQGKQKVYELELEDGKKIKVTDNHRLLTKRGYVELKCLKEGDNIITVDFMMLSSSKANSIKFVGEEDTYDIEMPVHHNFVCDDIVSHNSHSACYAIMAYQCQWLKANHPLEFYTTAMNFGKEDVDIPLILREVQEANLDIVVDKPDINKSSFEFCCDREEGRIFWSLNKIKGIGVATAEKIIQAREKVGKFKDFVHFCNNIPSGVNKKVIRILIQCGAFDSLCGIRDVKARRELLQELYELKFPKELKECKVLNDPASNKNYFWMLNQKELIGNGDVKFKELLNEHKHNISADYDYMEIKDVLSKKVEIKKFYNNGKTYGVIGFLMNFREFESKKGVFCKMEISANNYQIECIAWADEYSLIKDKIATWKGKLMFITGKIGFDDFRNKNNVYINSDSVFYEL